MRVTFAGPAPLLAAHAMHAPAAGIEPRFLDVRPGAEPRAVRGLIAAGDPDAVIALGVPGEAVEGLRAATLSLGEAEGFDRVLSPAGWRTRPLPVDDRLYAGVRPSGGPPKALCLIASTDRREWMLMLAKHNHDVLHYAHGLAGDALLETLNSTDVGITAAATDAGDFPVEALIHLAAGQLLIAEPFVPPCGLEPGIDYVAVASREDVDATLTQLKLRPDAYERIRIRGRLKAEEHRASKVWPRIVGDLLQDVKIFGNTLQA